MALFKHHTSAITSVEWHPSDGSVFGAAGADNQISLWDLAVSLLITHSCQEICVISMNIGA